MNLKNCKVFLFAISSFFSFFFTKEEAKAFESSSHLVLKVSTFNLGFLHKILFNSKPLALRILIPESITVPGYFQRLNKWKTYAPTYASDKDILLLQEVFGKSHSDTVFYLQKKFYPFMPDNNTVKASGLALFVKKDLIDFNKPRSSGFVKFLAKETANYNNVVGVPRGFLWAKFFPKNSNTPIFIINTHLDASTYYYPNNDLRKKQLHKIKNFIKKNSKFPSHLIFGGDLNFSDLYEDGVIYKVTEDLEKKQNIASDLKLYKEEIAPYFIDTYRVKNPTSKGHTYSDAQNIAALFHPLTESSPQQRLDVIFIQTSQSSSEILVRNSEVGCKEHFDDIKIPLNQHHWDIFNQQNFKVSYQNISPDQLKSFRQTPPKTIPGPISDHFCLNSTVEFRTILTQVKNKNQNNENKIKQTSSQKPLAINLTKS